MNEKVVALGRDRIKIAKGAEKSVEVYLDETVEALLFHNGENRSNAKISTANHAWN